MVRRALGSLTFALLLATASAARADDPQPAPVTGNVDLDKDKNAQVDINAVPPEAPPPPPYQKTVVLDSSVGAMGLLGEFGKISPPGPWLHTQLGYELLKFLMLFGEGELAFTDTSRKVDPPKTRAYAIFGFGGGVRLTIRFTDRFGVYLQGSVGLMKADVATNALGSYGFRGAESLDTYGCGRLGVEWYQIDRHFALGLNFGLRSAQGFAKRAGNDSALMADGGASLRYAF